MRSQPSAPARCTWLLLVAALVAYARPAEASFPQPNGYVNDFAQVLTADQKAYLENYLRLLEHDTSAEVAVATVASLDGMSIEEYGNRLFAEWGIGKKREDNGVLLLVAPRERKVRIEVGYGLEPILPDGLAGEIIRTEILPEFRDGNIPRGIGRGLNRINYIVRRLPSAGAAAMPDASETGSGVPPVFVLVPFFGTFVALGAFMAGLGLRTKTAGPFIGGALFSGVPLVIGAAMGSGATLLALAPLGLITGLTGFRKGASGYWIGLLRKGTAQADGGPEPDGWIVGGTSGNSDGGGSDSSSSSSSSGSDFSGGSSGGGGASGSW